MAQAKIDLFSYLFTLQNTNRVDVNCLTGHVIHVKDDTVTETSSVILSVRILAGKAKGMIPWTTFVQMALHDLIYKAIAPNNIPCAYLVVKDNKAIETIQSPIVSIGVYTRTMV